MPASTLQIEGAAHRVTIARQAGGERVMLWN